MINNKQNYEISENSPLVSILVFAYNQEIYIEKALKGKIAIAGTRYAAGGTDAICWQQKQMKKNGSGPLSCLGKTELKDKHA